MSKRLNPPAQAAYDRAIEAKVSKRVNKWWGLVVLGMVLNAAVWFAIGIISPYLYSAFAQPSVDTPVVVFTSSGNWHQAYLNSKGEWIEMCDGHKISDVQEWIKP